MSRAPRADAVLDRGLVSSSPPPMTPRFEPRLREVRRNARPNRHGSISPTQRRPREVRPQRPPTAATSPAAIARRHPTRRDRRTPCRAPERPRKSQSALRSQPAKPGTHLPRCLIAGDAGASSSCRPLAWPGATRTHALQASIRNGSSLLLATWDSRFSSQPRPPAKPAPGVRQPGTGAGLDASTGHVPTGLQPKTVRLRCRGLGPATLTLRGERHLRWSQGASRVSSWGLRRLAVSAMTFAPAATRWFRGIVIVLRGLCAR